MKRLRVEPISSYLERRRKGPIYPVMIANGFVYLSGLPPFDPATGDIKPATFERQAELVLDQMKLCLETAGSSLAQVLKCNVYCTPNPSHFTTFNEVYARYFPSESPAASFCMSRLSPGRSMSRWIAWRWCESSAHATGHPEISIRLGLAVHAVLQEMPLPMQR